VTVINDTLTETITVSQSEVQNMAYAPILADGVRAFDFLDPVRGVTATLTETVTMTGTPSYVLGVVVTERILIDLSSIENSRFQATLVDSLELLDAVTVGYPVTINETVTVTLTQLAQQVVTIIEQLGIADVVAPVFAYHLTVAETITLADALVRFFGVEVNEVIGIQDVMLSSALHPATIDEAITLADLANPQMVLRVTVEDSVSLDDVDVLNMIYSGTISEGIEIVAAYLSPADGITTWSMNTRTAAVTEYSNYAFNSFAQMGHKYLGASDDGLYELVGDDDDGESIIAHIKSGFAQWAGSHFTMFKGIYLGVRGDGAYVLKLITGDGKTYIYNVAAQDMRTTKITTGKGLRARYFAFELISAGQDFDLDTIEFVPLAADRRV
jgi:hypothetical protein